MYTKEQWYEHIKDAVNYRPVKIGNSEWTRKTIAELTEEKMSFGTKSIVFVEALLDYIKECCPEKYSNVIKGLWETIEYYEEKDISQEKLKNYLRSLSYLTHIKTFEEDK